MPFYENYGQQLVCMHFSTPNCVMPVYHIHPHWELYYCPTAHQQITFVNGQTLTYTQPLAILSSPFSQHGTQVSKTHMHYERSVFYFGDEFLTTISPTLFSLDEFHGSTACFFPLSDAACATLSPIADQIVASDRESERILLFSLFFIRLCDAVPPEKRHYIGDANNYIHAVMRYIFEHLAEQLTISDLSARFFVGHDKLSRDFRNYTGSTVHQFIVNLRLARACELLLHKNNDLSIAEIGRQCGFENSYYFTAFFRTHMQLTPREYARRN